MISPITSAQSYECGPGGSIDAPTEEAPARLAREPQRRGRRARLLFLFYFGPQAFVRPALQVERTSPCFGHLVVAERFRESEPFAYWRSILISMSDQKPSTSMTALAK